MLKFRVEKRRKRFAGCWRIEKSFSLGRAAGRRRERGSSRWPSREKGIARLLDQEQVKFIIRKNNYGSFVPVDGVRENEMEKSFGAGGKGKEESRKFGLGEQKRPISLV